jgi:hypothetical protein
MQQPTPTFQMMLTDFGTHKIARPNRNVIVETLIHFCVELKCLIFGTKNRVAKKEAIIHAVSMLLLNSQPKAKMSENSTK